MFLLPARVSPRKEFPPILRQWRRIVDEAGRDVIEGRCEGHPDYNGPFVRLRTSSIVNLNLNCERPYVDTVLRRFELGEPAR
jgi:hypothetical protein